MTQTTLYFVYFGISTDYDISYMLISLFCCVHASSSVHFECEDNSTCVWYVYSRALPSWTAHLKQRWVFEAFVSNRFEMVFSGVLSKMGSIIPNVSELDLIVDCLLWWNNYQWKPRHFVLDGNKLTYFASEGGMQKGQYIITADTVLAVSDSIVVDHVFVLQNRARTLYLSASSDEDLHAWMMALENSIQHSI